MKKKTKLFATLTAICTSICLMVIGVIAASQVNLNVTSSVSFQSNGAYVKVKGEVQKGNADTEPVRAVEPEGSDYYYIGYSYDAVDKEQETDTQVSDYNDTPVGTPSVSPMTSWTIGNVEFSENESIIRYNLTFTNYSEKPVQATITTNKDAFLSDPEIQGKVNINETSKSVIIDGYDGTTPKTATYSITLTLTNFSTSFTNKGLTIDVNFSTEIMEPEPEELVPGLTVTISDEDKKEATIVDYAGNATNIVIPESFNFAEKEMPNSIIFESEDNTPPMAFKAMLCFGDLNIIFGDGTKIEGVNFLEMEGSMIEATYPITFEQTYTLKIENNELDMQLLAQIPMLVTEMAAGLGVTVELPKVKENGIAEWREFQDVEEFSTYVSSIMEAPGIANFPLEFEFEPPKHMLAVEGNDYTVTSIGDNAFYNCSSLTSVTISSSVTSIGNSAFSSCSSLATVTFGDNSALESIGSYAFSGCRSLKSIEIPENVTSIEGAFAGCSSLTSVTIPSSVTIIGWHAFRYCSSLTSVTIPSSVTSIRNSAFDGCSKLTSITVLSITPPALTSTAIPSNIEHIYVPAASEETYKAAADWNEFADKISAIV